MKQTVYLKNITRKSGFRLKLVTVGEILDDLSNDGVVEMMSEQEKYNIQALHLTTLKNNIFSFSNNVFRPTKDRNQHFSHIHYVIC